MLYWNKNDWILKFVAGKDVLDLGCVHHNMRLAESKGWLHGAIVGKARSVLGVDILESEVMELRRRGYDVVCDNVESMQLGRKFDVIVAGDLIEHLNNYGLFLERARDHLADDGVLLLTTPNPVNLMRFFSVLFRGNAGANPEHTCWFTEHVLLQLVERYGFRPREIVYVDDTYQYYFKKWYRVVWIPFLALNFIVARIRHQFAETICLALEQSA